MKKKILIISSEYTGNGHKSVSNSLVEAFLERKDYELHEVDGFSFGGWRSLLVSKIYAFISSNMENLWKVMWFIIKRCPKLPCFMAQAASRKGFLKALHELKPELIVSVHPTFNHPLINILLKDNIKIPFITVILDLVSISPVWIDPRADFIICVTEEGRKRCLEAGVPDFKVKTLGFPLRQVFNSFNNDYVQKINRNLDYQYEFLLLSGGNGNDSMLQMAKTILNNFDCKLNIIVGRNLKLKKKLMKLLCGKYGKKVEILGFVNNIRDYMVSADLIISRGSSNAIMETISCYKPLAIFCCLPGQEQGNDEFVEKNKFGISCTDCENSVTKIMNLFSDNNMKINEIKKAQYEFHNPLVAKNYVDFLIEFMESI